MSNKSRRRSGIHKFQVRYKLGGSAMIEQRGIFYFLQERDELVTEEKIYGEQGAEDPVLE